MYEDSGELTVLLITIWWLQKLGKDWQQQGARKFGGERFKLMKLNDLEVREQYQVEITNRFAALENISDGEDINRVLENIKKNIKTSAKENLGLHEMKQHKPWFDGCLRFLDQRNQAEMHWVQDPSQSHVDSLNNVRHEASRNFREKTKTYLKDKIEEFETKAR